MKIAIACVLLASACGGSTSPPTQPDDPTDWCQRIVAGPASVDPASIALANAHMTYRYFGTASIDAVDRPLVASYANAAVDLDAYARAASDVCALTSSTKTLGRAVLTLHGDVAWLVPGTGDVAIPDGAAAIAIDLRGIPDVPELADALARITTLALTSPLHRSITSSRYDGFPDSWFMRLSDLPESAGLYRASLDVVPDAAWPGTADHERPIAIISDVAMPAIAAELAIDVRNAKLGWLVGHGVLARVAEATWRPVGSRGLAVRTGLISVDDVIPADFVPADVDSFLSDSTAIAGSVPALPALPALADAQPTRPSPRTLDFYNWPPEGADDTATLKAAVSVAYGTARAFFPIRAVWPTTIDAALDAALVEASAPISTRFERKAIVEHFAASLQDGHVYVADFAPDPAHPEFTAAISVTWDVIAGEPVVATSTVPQLHPGDAVTAVDGTPVAAFLAPYGARVSSATPLNHAVNTALRLSRFTASSRTFSLRAADGTTRTETVTATGFELPLFGPQRASGTLDDVGAPDVYYIDLNGSGPNYTSAQLLSQLDTARSSKGLVIDGRGYPGTDLTQLLARIIGAAAPSPKFHVPTFAGANIQSADDSQYVQAAPTGATYDKPVAILIGPQTQSFAENILMILSARSDIDYVGRQTSGSNGNITSVMLPGGYGMAFTGMRVAFPDGRPFHGIGITPTIESEPTAADLAAGIDTEMMAGISAVRARASIARPVR